MSTGKSTLVVILVASALAVAWAGVSYLALGIGSLGIGCWFLLLAYQLYGTANDKKEEKDKRTNISPIASPARSSDGDSDANENLLPGRRRRSTDGQAGLDSRGPNINGVKLVDWRGATVRFNDIWPFENEFFKGHVLFMLKCPEDTRYAEHFKGKQRLFEMQIQGQFKKLPEGTLHMGAELTEKMQLGIVTKMVAGTVLAFGRRVIKNMHYSFGESMKGASNPDEIELPHVTFPLTRGMDRLIVTEPGGTPPPLGKEFFESEESRLARKAGKDIEFKLGNTYSFSFHSMYLDFSRWEMVNIAGQKSIDLAQYFGESSVNIVVYDMDPNLAAGKHRKCDKRYFYHCEIVNTNLAGDDAGADTLVDNKMEEGEASSVFVRSGDVVPLVATPADKGPVEGPWCLTDSKGYCVIRQGASPMEVNVAKVGGVSAFYRSDFLCNGDVVTLRNSHTGKYLSVYKGWWLYWSSSGPNSSVSRCHFVIHGLDEAERLTVGKPFTLRSSKWHTYEIGVTDTVSAEYGGRMVGLYQTSKTKKMFQSKKSKTWLQPVLLKAQAPREDPLGVTTTRINLNHPDDEAGGGIGVSMGGPGSRSVSPARVAAEREEEEKVEGLDPFLDNAVNVTVEDIENLLEVEVPAWIEMMHRRRKKPQLAYLLRVRFRDRTDIGWIALRTGLDLALIMQMRRDRLFDGAIGDKEDLSTSQHTYRLQKAGTPGLKRKSGGYPPGQRPLQHQNPADQSARLLSQLLSDITAASSGPSSNTSSNGHDTSAPDLNHPLPPSCKTALYSLLKKRNYLDVWFLTGVASDIGVTVPSRPAPLMQSMIARGLWESHWREEWMVLYHSHVSFFPSGSKKTGWFLCLHEILSVRPVDKAKTPFAGKAFMAIETLGRIHYLCFANEATRDAWMSQLNSRCGNTTYEIPSGVVLSDPREAFVLKSGEWRPSNRIILNARRMCFDIIPPAFSPWQLSERALRLVYDLSPDSGTERLAAFLDLCAGFKMISLQQLDPAAEETLCFFLNVYHTLIQHALLLLGPPSSRDWSAFFSSVSYEIGGDVFSLAEIEYCIVRGKLSRPRTLPRYWPAPPGLEDDHYRYALENTDFRVNFALNCGSISGPPFVTVYRPDKLDKQLDNVTVRFLDFTIKLDSKKRTITLPKVCDLYRADFSDGDMLEVVKSLLRFLDRVKWERVSWALAGVKAPIIKASPLKLKCHENLCLLVDDPSP